jgi:large subunit ribosomal protein L28
MARVDALTGKRAQSGNNRSKSLKATKRKWNVNLQPVTIEINGKKQRVMISAKTLRTLKNKGKIGNIK